MKRTTIFCIALGLIGVQPAYGNTSNNPFSSSGVVEVEVIRTNENAENVFLRRIKATKTKEVLRLQDLQILNIAYRYCPDQYSNFQMKNAKLNKLYKKYSLKYLCLVPKQVQVNGGFQTIWVPNTTE